MLARCSLAMGFLLFWTTLDPISARPGVRADEPSAKKNSSDKTSAAQRSLKANDDSDEKDSAARQQLVDVVTAADCNCTLLNLRKADRKSLAHYLWEKGNREITVELPVFSKDSPA
jgi:hypothetical protein